MADSGNLQPDVEYVGFVLGAKTEMYVKPTGEEQPRLKLRIGSLIDTGKGWEDGNKRWIDTELWLTPAAQAGTQKRIEEAFEVPLERQNEEFWLDPTKVLYKKPCRFTTELHTYKERSEIRVKWINHVNPPKRGEIRDASHSDVASIMARTKPRVDQGGGGGFDDMGNF